MIADVDWARIGTIFILWGLGWFIARQLLGLVRRAVAKRADDAEDEKRITTVVRAAKQALNVIVIAIIVMLLLSEFGISITPLLGAAGVVGIAIGLASQGIARDFLRGFSLLVNNQLRVGDTVELAGKSGVVENLSMSYVVLRDDDGSVHFVPSGEIRIVTNRSHGYSVATVDLELETDANIEQVMRAVRRAADEVRTDPNYAHLVLAPAEVTEGVGPDASSAVVRARIRTVPHGRATVRREMARRIHQCCERDGVK